MEGKDAEYTYDYSYFLRSADKVDIGRPIIIFCNKGDHDFDGEISKLYKSRTQQVDLYNDVVYSEILVISNTKDKLIIIVQSECSFPSNACTLISHFLNFIPKSSSFLKDLRMAQGLNDMDKFIRKNFAFSGSFIRTGIINDYQKKMAKYVKKNII